jgi:sec-independent protein translocase protein TatB
VFDIGFSEIVVIGVVALVVIGPERLPKTARTVGLLFGRLQRYVNDVKADISREMELDELRKLQRDMQGAAQEFEQSVKSAASDLSSNVRSVEQELNSTVSEAASSAASSSTTPATSSDAHALPAAEPDAQPAKQAALPGFDKI